MTDDADKGTPLHRMPDGTWLSLGEIVSIQPWLINDPKERYPGSVEVRLHRHVLRLRFTSYAKAAAYADELAALVNAERARS